MSGKKLYILKLDISHGSDRHEISLYSNSQPTVAELMNELEKKTRVPFSLIQIIFKGQKLHFNPNAPLAQFGIFSGSRLMMVGEKLNSNNDAIFRRILGIGKDVELVVKSLKEATNEFSLMETGSIDKSLAKEYIPQLNKRIVLMKRDLEAFYSVLNEVDLSKYDLPNDVHKHQANIKNYILKNITNCETVLNKISKIN